MADELQFDYYYGREAEQFSFLRVPKLLIKDERFKGLSSDAKLLYGLLLDRMSLSVKNEWFDDEERVYIIYTIEQIAEDLGCGRDKAIKTLAELDSKKGIGLVEKKNRGLGLPAIIYVKNFVSAIKDMDRKNEENVDSVDNVNNLLDENIEENAHKASKIKEVGNVDFKKSEKQTSRSREIRPQEVGKTDFKESKNQISGSRENRLQEVEKSDPNNTNIIYTDTSNTDINKTEIINTESDLSNLILSISREREVPSKVFKNDEMDLMEFYKEEIKENIDYDIMVNRMDFGKRELFQEIYDIMCDIVCIRREKIRINGTDYPYEVVKSRFMKLNSMHIDYVLDCMSKTVSDIGNIRAYLITALFNAPDTINHYYQQMVNHDLYVDAVSGS